MNVQELYRLTTQREQSLKQVIRSRPTEVQEIETLRKTIRESYARVLFQDPIYAASKDVEQSLWKTCFYRKIEEFRKKIRKYASAASSAESKALANKARADLHNVCGEFGDFISEALTFYQDLMGRYELLQATQEEERQRHHLRAGVGGISPAPPALEHDCVKSIHRCLIFLGDLARYRELHSESTRKDWSLAEKWYYQAIDVMPTSGNPHNQLAVLATYTEAECVAVYRYCRALLCECPFPTAKENLSLLFEKNKQGLPDFSTPEGQEEQEEEERVRQGLAAGTITGQQAGIARATMLKSLLQRFVRLHGMLFSNRQQAEHGHGSGSSMEEGPFPVADFMAMLQTAMLDLRQLLKMSAFGDGLLLHMVVICVFSVLTSMADSGDHEAALEDSSVQSLSLSLAFGVVSEIAACVRTARQESEHTTAKPPGSRLLGPVVVFCDWMASRHSLWRLKSLGSSSVAGGPCLPEKETEAAIREQFWRAICKVATELQVQLQPFPAGIPDELIWMPHDGRVLKEQHDLRGFEPLQEVYGMALMTRPKSELGRLEIVSDDLASTWRTIRLVRFLQEVGVACGTVACAENPSAPGCWIFQSQGRENVMASAAAARRNFGTTLPGALMGGGTRGRRAQGAGGFDEEGEEVIVFKPSFASPSGTGFGLTPMGMGSINVPTPPHLLQQHQRQPSLDDSSQLPKDMVESMLGGLLDCSDSGPHPNYLGGIRPPPGSGVQASGYPGGINTAGHVQPPGSGGRGEQDTALPPFFSRTSSISSTDNDSNDKPTVTAWQQQQQQQHQQQQQPVQQQNVALKPSASSSSTTSSIINGGGPTSAFLRTLPGASDAPHTAAPVATRPVGSSGAVGWNNFATAGHAHTSSKAPPSAAASSSMTPPPPGLGSFKGVGVDGTASMFAEEEFSFEEVAGEAGKSPIYKPFGGGAGLLGLAEGSKETGRHSAPPGTHLATKNPFLSNGFNFVP